MNSTARRALRTVLSSTALIALLGITSGCVADGVTFRTLEPVLSPFSEVTLEIDHENRTIQPDPDPVIIWFDSQNPLSQILWTVRCVHHEEGNKDDITCPPNMTVIIRPKEGCSTTLFGSTEGAPEGEIRIQAPANAVASGEPNLEEATALLAESKETETHCDGTSKKDDMPMQLSQSKHDIKWAYEIEVRRGEDSFSLDPAVWIETDD
ncbi:MAG: hypothetical protein AAF657_22980 [Acidobacteriota bacterium]